jgi:hypothetical protein
MRYMKASTAVFAFSLAIAAMRPDFYRNTYTVPHNPYVMAVTDRVVTGRTPGTASDALAAALTFQGCADRVEPRDDPVTLKTVMRPPGHRLVAGRSTLC